MTTLASRWLLYQGVQYNPHLPARYGFGEVLRPPWSDGYPAVYEPRRVEVRVRRLRWVSLGLTLDLRRHRGTCALSAGQKYENHYRTVAVALGRREWDIRLYAVGASS